MSSEPESRKNDDKDDNGSKKKIAGVPVNDIISYLKELRFSKGADQWRIMQDRHFKRSLERKFKLEDGKLKNVDLSSIIDTAEDEYRIEDMKAKAKKRKDEEKKKKEEEKQHQLEKDEKDQQEKSEPAAKKNNYDKPKRRRDSSSERASRKTKRHSSSSGSESERKRKSTKSNSKHSSKKIKRDPEDPVVQKIERLKKVIRGCGVPLTGFHKDMSSDRTLRKLIQIIQSYEKEGMKEKMGRSDMLKVRASIEAQREVDELKSIPKKLQVSGKHPRKVTRNKPKYDMDLDKSSSSASDESPSEDPSNYSSGAD